MIPKLATTCENDEQNVFGSRTVFVMILLYRIMGLSNTLILPQVALINGALGSLLIYVLCYVIFGIPITYMELIVSQFTGRDCIDMWKIRPCLSHIGYFVQFWQIVLFVYNHSISSVLLHYLIISFENPPLYSYCGYWSTESCNIIKLNHTANQRCVRVRDNAVIQECDDLYTSYPEYQYYAYNLFEGHKHDFFVAWPICVASTVVLIIIFFNCFRRITSLKWFLYPMTIYPMLGYLLLLMGSMRQKGLISHYAEAMDVDFDHFTSRFRLSHLLLQTLYSTGAGSGIISNLSSLAPFRSPCFSNAVTVVLTSAVFTCIAVITSAMMACPYANEYGGPELIIYHPISFAFIKLPKMLSEYNNRSAWLLLAFSCQCVLGINQNVIIFYSSLEIIAKRYPKIGKYSALSTLIILIIIFIITTPTLGTLGKDIISVTFRKSIFLVSIFYAILESLVFLVWYGFGRFYEDIHFMQGIQPKTYLKISWMLLPFILAYVFLQDFITLEKTTKSRPDMFGYVLMIIAITMPVVIFLIKLVVAAFQKKFLNQFKLDSTWGPQEEVLRRSRAMFTAHAMTKEYMYRQYRLQAGVVARQQLSNVRTQKKFSNDYF